MNKLTDVIAPFIAGIFFGFVLSFSQSCQSPVKERPTIVDPDLENSQPCIYDAELKGAAVQEVHLEIFIVEEVDPLPRGIRNNNPGNIIKTNQPWKGKVECPDSTFECFENEKYGVRAMTIILDRYYREYELNTVEGIISKWAEVNHNFIPFVANRLGLERDEEFSVEERMEELINAIIYFENGMNPYSTQTIREGMDTAGGR